MVSILLLHGTLLTMDSQRGLIQDGAVAIDKTRIIDIGPTKELADSHDAQVTIDATGKVIMPGLIDTHGHAGHSLVKTVAEDRGDDWIPIMETFYKEATTPDYWRIDGQLAALERLKFGVTCGLSYLGSCARTDDPIYALKHSEGAARVGIRDVVAVGPGRPPYPNKYVKWEQNTPTEVHASFERNLEVTEDILRKLRDFGNDRLDLVLSPPSITINSLTPDGQVQDLPDFQEKAEAMKHLLEKWDLKLHTHAYSPQIKFVDEKTNLLGPQTSLAHCIGLTKEEIQILAKTDSKVCHSPSARSIIPRRCPVVELLDAGVTVAISTDGSAPDRTFDLFKELRQAMSVQRHYFKNENIMPPGKAIEMVTVDAARTLGYESEIGSLEVGKKADIIIIDMMKPHLIPMFMIPHRIAYGVSGQDVDTVIVDGEILMEHRQVRTVNEREILEIAQEEAENAATRGQLEKYLQAENPDRFWGHTSY
ncbi:MAG: amidohydrolase family protein [Candidatus Hodarchaeales archaeon]|jgi:cytosine/adenosine deaminase-related metal-dependent hydrolase